jgi:hypothetical protein
MTELTLLPVANPTAELPPVEVSGHLPWPVLMTNILGVTVPFLTLFAARVFFWGEGFSWVDLALLLTLYFLTALVIASEGLRAPEVTDGIHAPGDVVDKEDADQPPPDQARPNTHPGSGKQPAQHGWNQQTEPRPNWEQHADPTEQFALAQVLDIAAQVGRVRMEEPAHVCMPQSGQHPNDPSTVQMRRGRVAGLVAVRMMTTMQGNPIEERALNGHRTKDGEHEPYGSGRLKGSVSEQPVKSDRDAECSFEAKRRGGGAAAESPAGRSPQGGRRWLSACGPQRVGHGRITPDTIAAAEDFVKSVSLPCMALRTHVPRKEPQHVAS